MTTTGEQVIQGQVSTMDSDLNIVNDRRLAIMCTFYKGYD